MTPPLNERKLLTGRDLAILIGVAVLLLGPSVWSGRPLSVHEARLPQLAKEMVWGDGDWLLPTSGGRPWLERPPLPHWATAASMMLFGRVGSYWSARLPAAVAGTLIAWMSAWMSARWFGRKFGLLAGLVTLTTYELYQYSSLAEDDIYLGLVAVAAMAMFVRAQWPDRRLPAPPSRNLLVDFIAPRPGPTILFFVFLGLTNLAKGPLVGAVPVIATVGLYLLWARDWRGVRHFAWLWGWLIFLALTVAWPWWAMRHYPDIVDNWRFDYQGKYQGHDIAAAHAWDHPWWYYPAMLPLSLAPWTWATIVGLFVAARRGWRGSRRSPKAFVFFWAIVGVGVLSLPMRKHHQYLVPVMAPWAILGAFGVVHVGRWLHARAAWVTVPRLAGWVIGGVVIAAAVVQIGLAGRDPRTLAEAELLARVKTVVPSGDPVLINADLGSLNFFRIQYTLRHEQLLIHNLSYLLQPELDYPSWYVLTRGQDKGYLQTLGTVKRLAEARLTARDKTPGHNLTLF